MLTANLFDISLYQFDFNTYISACSSHMASESNVLNCFQFWTMSGVTSGVFIEKRQLGHSAKHISCSTEESKSYGSGATWGWVMTKLSFFRIRWMLTSQRFQCITLYPDQFAVVKYNNKRICRIKTWDDLISLDNNKNSIT